VGLARSLLYHHVRGDLWPGGFAREGTPSPAGGSYRQAAQLRHRHSPRATATRNAAQGASPCPRTAAPGERPARARLPRYRYRYSQRCARGGFAREGTPSPAGGSYRQAAQLRHRHSPRATATRNAAQGASPCPRTAAPGERPARARLPRYRYRYSQRCATTLGARGDPVPRRWFLPPGRTAAPPLLATRYRYSQRCARCLPLPSHCRSWRAASACSATTLPLPLLATLRNHAWPAAVVFRSLSCRAASGRRALARFPAARPAAVVCSLALGQRPAVGSPYAAFGPAARTLCSACNTMGSGQRSCGARPPLPCPRRPSPATTLNPCVVQAASSGWRRH